MHVPNAAIVGTVAIMRLIEEGGIVEIRVGCHGSRQNACIPIESDLKGIDRGRPDIREHLAASELPGRNRSGRACLARHSHVEHRSVPVRRYLGVHDVERGQDSGGGRVTDATRMGVRGLGRAGLSGRQLRASRQGDQRKRHRLNGFAVHQAAPLTSAIEAPKFMWKAVPSITKAGTDLTPSFSASAMR